MNIAVSIEDQVAERAREKASDAGVTLEQAVENYIRRLANGDPKPAGTCSR